MPGCLAQGRGHPMLPGRQRSPASKGNQWNGPQSGIVASESPVQGANCIRLSEDLLFHLLREACKVHFQGPKLLCGIKKKRGRKETENAIFLWLQSSLALTHKVAKAVLPGTLRPRETAFQRGSRLARWCVYLHLQTFFIINISTVRRIDENLLMLL